MTPEERAEIRARVEADVLSWQAVGDVRTLLAALDVCEAERDRAVEALRGIVEEIHQDDWIYEDYFTDSQTDARYERKKVALREARTALGATGESNE